MPRRSPTGAKPEWSELYGLAAAAAGFFTAAAARAAGYSPQLLNYHLRQGHLERAGRGLFRLTQFPPGEHEDLVVLWLWSREEGVFSHETALRLHDLSDVLPSKTHMILPPQWENRRIQVPARTVLSYDNVLESDRTWMGAVPVTKPLKLTSASGAIAIRFGSRPAMNLKISRNARG